MAHAAAGPGGCRDVCRDGYCLAERARQHPVHFGINGEANRYGGKVEGLLALPLVALGVLVLLNFLPRIDPLRERYAQFATAYAVAILAI